MDKAALQGLEDYVAEMGSQSQPAFKVYNRTAWARSRTEP